MYVTFMYLCEGGVLWLSHSQQTLGLDRYIIFGQKHNNWSQKVHRTHMAMDMIYKMPIFSSTNSFGN